MSTRKNNDKCDWFGQAFTAAIVWLTVLAVVALVIYKFTYDAQGDSFYDMTDSNVPYQEIMAADLAALQLGK